MSASELHRRKIISLGHSTCLLCPSMRFTPFFDGLDRCGSTTQSGTSHKFPSHWVYTLELKGIQLAKQLNTSPANAKAALTIESDINTPNFPRNDTARTAPADNCLYNNVISKDHFVMKTRQTRWREK